MVIIDGKSAVLGRLASYTAQQLLKGEEVWIVNAEHIVITGNRQQLKDKYLARRKRGSPQHGPFYPKQPDLIVKRAIRGMLPYKTTRGRTAYKRLRVFTGVPEACQDKEARSVAVKEIEANFVYVKDIAEALGWKK